MTHTITDEQFNELRRIAEFYKAVAPFSGDKSSQSNKLSSILNTIEKQPEIAWMPIETAPRDGTLFLSWSEDYGQCVGSMSHGCFDICGQEDIEYRPTHWMPLPPPPATPAQQAEAELIEGMHKA